MKVDIWSVCKDVLKKWWILVVALAVGFGAGFFVYNNDAKNATYQAFVQLYLDQDLPEGNLTNSEYSPNLYTEKINKMMDNAFIALNDPAYLQNAFETANISFNNTNKKMLEIKKVSTNIITITFEYSNEVVASEIIEKLADTSFVQINSTLFDNIDSVTNQIKAGTATKDQVSVRTTNLSVVENNNIEATTKGKVIASAIYAAVGFVVAFVVLVCIRLASSKITSAREVELRFDAVDCEKFNSTVEGVETIIAREFASGEAKTKKILLVGNHLTEKDVNGVCENISKTKSILKVTFGERESEKIEKVSSNLTNCICGGNGIFEQINNFKEILEKNEKDFDLILLVYTNLTSATSAFAKMVDNVLVNVKLNKDNFSSLHKLNKNLEMNKSEISSIIITK